MSILATAFTAAGAQSAAEIAKTKRRALIVQHSYELAAHKIADEVRTTDKSDGLEGVARQLARKET